jgi:hypothetical protein
VAQERDPFVLVLLDGNANIFTKDLLSKGEKGGQEAASYLFEVVSTFIAEQLHHLEAPRIILRIYANFKLMSEMLAKLKIIDRPGTFDEFVRGLNGSQPLFDLIDAGSTTKDKVIEGFAASSTDCHCRHIILGCSSDDKYAKLLDQTKQGHDLTRLTLLETLAFENDVATLKTSFSTTKFDKVFRTTKLTLPTPPAIPKGPLPGVVAQLPALARVESNGTTGSASSASTPAITWANLASQPTPTPPKPAVVACAPTPRPTSANKTIDRNRHGQRIDKVDNTIPNHELQRIKKLKLCNIYYLQGSQFCTPSSNNGHPCSHSHSYNLTKAEKNVLREVARMTPCYYKMECEDPECIYGHKCPQSKEGSNECWYGEDCRFYGWGHGVDMRVVKTLRV